VLLHGILVSSWAWRFNLDALSQHFRVLAVCQKGHGWSGRNADDYSIGALARFVSRLLDKLGIDRFHLVGNSLGGAVSLRLTLDEPHRVDRLILVDAAAVPVMRSIDRIMAVQSGILAPVYRTFGRPWVFQLLLRTLAYRALPIDRHYMEWFMSPLRQKGTIKAAVHVIRELQPGLQQIFENLHKIERPVQLIWGRHDRLVPLKAGLILNRTLPTSRLEVLSHCGHCAHEEDPERFNEIALAFLTEERG